jgi:hypothetical protein
MIEFSACLRDCFPEYPVPSGLRTDCDCSDVDSLEVLMLRDVAWTHVPPNFWRDHWSAYSALSPYSFVYYLPSMLESSLQNDCDLFRDFLVGLFDTSGNPDIFSSFLSERIDLLTLQQVRCLIFWAEIMTELRYFSDENEEERVKFTLLLFEERKFPVRK